MKVYRIWKMKENSRGYVEESGLRKYDTHGIYLRKSELSKTEQQALQIYFNGSESRIGKECLELKGAGRCEDHNPLCPEIIRHIKKN